MHSVMFFEPLESRRLLSATIEVTAKRAAAYEEGPSSRFMYIRRSGPTDAPRPGTIRPATAAAA